MTIRLLGRCIDLEKRGYPIRYSLPQGFMRGGQRTPWPWWSVRVGRIELTVSRTRPRKHLPDQQ